MFASSACLTSPAGGAAPEWQEPVASLGLPLASRQQLLWSCPRASGWGRLLICGEGTFCPVLLLSLGAGKVHGSCKAPESKPGEVASFPLSRLIVSVLDGVLSVTGPLRPHSKLNLRAAGPARWTARLPFETPDWGLKRQIYFLTVVEAGRPRPGRLRAGFLRALSPWPVGDRPPAPCTCARLTLRLHPSLLF